MPLPLIATGLWSAFGSIVLKFLSDSLLKWLAWKVFIVTIVTITLPIVLKNLITWLFQTVMTVVASHVPTTGLSAAAFNFTGFAGYLAYHLLIPESIAVILTGLSIRLILNFIPFVG